MSGGHFNYAYSTMRNFVEDLKDEIKENDRRAYPYSDETISLLKRIKWIVGIAAYLARKTEWLYSGDIGEDYFRAGVKEGLGALKRIT